jgi:hypothetical protein
METAPTKMYCEKMLNFANKPFLTHFYPSAMQVRMCRSAGVLQEILPVVVSEGPETPDCYWGWWDEEQKRFSIVYWRRMQVEICFTYGYKIEEEQGKGKLVPVIVERSTENELATSSIARRRREHPKEIS